MRSSPHMMRTRHALHLNSMRPEIGSSDSLVNVTLLSTGRNDR
jgi:hypothetical protein